MKTTWVGDKTNGVEYRWNDDGKTLDQVRLYVGGKCVMRMLAMGDVCYLFGFDPPGHERVEMNIASRSGRAAVDATSPDMEPTPLQER